MHFSPTRITWSCLLSSSRKPIILTLSESRMRLWPKSILTWIQLGPVQRCCPDSIQVGFFLRGSSRSRCVKTIRGGWAGQIFFRVAWMNSIFCTRNIRACGLGVGRRGTGISLTESSLVGNSPISPSPPFLLVLLQLTTWCGGSRFEWIIRKLKHNERQSREEKEQLGCQWMSVNASEELYCPLLVETLPAHKRWQRRR